ncbi:hypothetical protein [Lactococcus lactis]|uniref:hypothetical protein n=1 Tax=Lactococcus lactis TaxID=1358 RepID=UPI00071C8863|nr:hypothetical protein [Lactococcus lactis]
MTKLDLIQSLPSQADYSIVKDQNPFVLESCVSPILSSIDTLLKSNSILKSNAPQSGIMEIKESNLLIGSLLSLFPIMFDYR